MREGRFQFIGRTLCMACTVAMTCLGAEAPAPLGPIAISNGGFVVSATGRPFEPRGFNYIRLGPWHATFDPARYDDAAAGEALRRMRADGFNTVRVFINTEARLPGAVATNGAPGLSRAYLRNVADSLAQARRTGIAVMLDTETFPRVSPYVERLRPLPPEIHPANAHYLDTGHLEAKAAFLRDFIGGLKAEDASCLEAVFAYDLQNELCYHIAPPFTLVSGAITSANGRVYAMPEQRRELAEESAVHYIDRMCAAIRAAHLGALVGASVFTFRAVGRRGPGDFTPDSADWRNRLPFRPLAILDSKADYLDLHFYPANADEFERDLVSIEFEAVRGIARERGKPILVGEFGVFKRPHPELDDAAAWAATLARRFRQLGLAGWLYWTYDTHEQSDELWYACERSHTIYRRLAEVIRGEQPAERARTEGQPDPVVFPEL